MEGDKKKGCGPRGLKKKKSRKAEREKTPPPNSLLAGVLGFGLTGFPPHPPPSLGGDEGGVQAVILKGLKDKVEAGCAEQRCSRVWSWFNSLSSTWLSLFYKSREFQYTAGRHRVGDAGGTDGNQQDRCHTPF